MSRVEEFVGCRVIEIADYDGNGDNLYSQWLTKESIVRCRDCENASEEYIVEHSEMEPCPDGKLDCLHFSQWDYYDDMPGHFFVEPDGYCAWGKRRKCDD